MNKKVLIIGGGVVVLGAIGYLYFTNKKKQEEILSGGASATQPSATTQTGATSVDVVYTKQDINLERAKKLVERIVTPKATFAKDAFKTKYIQQLKDLGYVYNENNGVLTKL